MSREKDFEDMQEFVDEYENIKEKLEDLLDDTTNEDLKEESLVKEYYSMRL